MEIIIGITGASGITYGVNLLRSLRALNACKLHLILSDTAKELIEIESTLELSEIISNADYHYENSNLNAVIASGSKLLHGMVIVPCSMSTAAKINTGITDNLISRAADVCIKERRKLIIVPRETPLNNTHLKNLLDLSEKGVLVLPAMPAFYHRPSSIDDLINFITGKILDNLGITHELYERWSENK